MDKLELEGTNKTPKVNCDPSGLIELEGRSIPEHSVQFYEPIYHWLDEYTNNPASPTTVNVRLEYFNTSSSKCILDVFRRLEKIHKAGTEMEVNWFFEFDDDDMRETGADYQEILSMPINMREQEEMF